MQRVLYLQVLDYDRFSRNDPIGEVSIPLNKVDLTQMQTFWKDLKPCSDGSVRPYLQVPGWAANRPGPGCCSVAKSCLTLCNPMACSPPVFPVLHYLPEFAQTHLIESVMLCDPMDCSPPGCPWNSPAKNTGVGCHSLLRGIFPHPGIEPTPPALQGDSLPSESPGKFRWGPSPSSIARNQEGCGQGG